MVTLSYREDHVRTRNIFFFFKFYRRRSELISKYNVCLKTHLQEGLSEPEFNVTLSMNSEKNWLQDRFFGTISKTRLFKYTENFTAKKRKFSDKKKSDIFHISAQNIDCGYPLEPPRWGISNGYQQSMFLCRNKKGNAYPCKPSFIIQKWGLRWSKLYKHVFVMNVKRLSFATKR